MDESIIEEEFPQLKNITYLDHAGTTLYSQSQINSYHKDLSSNLYGNPHSNNPSSKLSTETIDQAREMILNHFNTDTDQYHVIFTSNCTSALYLLSQIFPWQASTGNSSELNNTLTYIDSNNHTKHSSSTLQSIFCYLEDNHTSVLGMRETASNCGAKIMCVSQDAIISLKNNLSEEQNTPLSLSSSTLSPSLPTLSSPLSSPPSLPLSPSPLSSSFPLSSTLSSTLSSPPPPTLSSPSSSTTLYHLFAYPAQSNFSGFKYPLEWSTLLPSKQAHIKGHQSIKGQWLVLLDGASFVATNHLDLNKYPAHFVTLSFYKLFGFPTGLGALLIRNDVVSILRERNYFGGGTVLVSTARVKYHVPRPLPHERFEDGTVSFLDITALKYGFESLNKLHPSIKSISCHTFQLAQLTYTQMRTLCHSNGSPLCLVYNKGDFTDRERQGGIIAFNLLRSDGSYIGYSEVDKLASVNDIHLRTGCFCNPGACQSALGLTSEQIIENMKAGHFCGDNIDLINAHPTGCVRISFGYMSTLKDVKIFINFLMTSFIDEPKSSETSNILPLSTLPTSVNTPPTSTPPTSTPPTSTPPTSTPPTSTPPISTPPISTPPTLLTDVSHDLRVGSVALVTNHDSVKEQYILERLIVYPVKSCSGYEVKEWSVGNRGLLWDRQWMILNERGAVLTQKQEPKLALIKPLINITNGTLTLTATGYSSITISYIHSSSMGSVHCKARVCGDKVQGIDVGDDVAKWSNDVLGRECRLVQMDPEHKREEKKHGSIAPSSLSLSNEAQYLLLTQSSLVYLHNKLTDQNHLSLESLTLRFRPNFVMKNEKGDKERESEEDNKLLFVENNWISIQIGEIEFKVIGHCSRCQMICVDQVTGSRSNEPLQTLLKLTGTKANFGIYLTRK